MSWVRFIIADSLAALISVPLMIWLGYTFSEQYDTLVSFMDEAKLWALLLAFPAVVIIYLLFIKRRKRQTARNKGQIKENSNAAEYPATENPEKTTEETTEDSNV